MLITFVDTSDTVIGYGSKSDAIKRGVIHRIVRVFVFNSRGQLLIQKRAPHVDVPNKWDQSAAGHVDQGEEYIQAGFRELKEEVGIVANDLKEIGKFYSEETDGGLIRKRYNMLYSTVSDSQVFLQKSEVSSTKWVSISELERSMKKTPEEYTQGFKKALDYYLHKTHS